jgi:hypothetical protein
MDIKELLARLKDAEKFYEDNFPKVGQVDFCIDCMKIYDSTKEYKDHSLHTTTFTDFEHDGIGEWIKALEKIMEIFAVDKNGYSRKEVKENERKDTL